MSKCYLFDLDGTLLKSDKTIPGGALKVLEEYRRDGKIIGGVTSRSESNSRKYLGTLAPDILITSGGAEVKVRGTKIFEGAFSAEKTREIIRRAKAVIGRVNITADATDGTFYRNYTPDEDVLERSWGDSNLTDFDNYDKATLKLCFEVFDEDKADRLIAALPGCDAVRFTDGYWYKFTPRGVNKESAIIMACNYLGIDTRDVAAFGDDIADIGMLELAGTGVAMGNSVDEVKAKADVVIGSNDDNGIEIYLRTVRIARMEEVFDRVSRDMGRAATSDIRQLEKYLATTFKSDYEADERGLLPDTLKRGVLSQDAIYNLLDDIELD